jgi:uncharacterized delta-60 repeat protein
MNLIGNNLNLKAGGLLVAILCGTGSIREVTAQGYFRDGTIMGTGNAVAIDGANRIVVGGAGTYNVARFLGNGLPDNSFSQDGKANVPGNQKAVMLAPDGRINLAGNLADNGLSAIRLLDNGTKDPNFNQASMPFGQIGVGIGIKAHTAVRQSDGKLILAGYSPYGGLGGTLFAAVRLKSDGALDNSFDGDGKLYLKLWGACLAADVQPDGKILLAGTGSSTGATVVRLLNSGQLDPSFGNGGVAGIGPGAIHAIKVLSDGRIMVAGSRAGMMLVARLESNGKLDKAFNGGKILAFGIGNFGNSVARAMAIQWWDGRIVLAGSSGGQLSAARITTDGKLDGTFSGDGKFNWSLTASDAAHGVAIQSDRKIVLVGSANNTLLVMRLTTLGNLDPTFPAKIPIPPTAPTAVSASDGTYSDKVLVAWNAVSGATSYKVYRTTSPSTISPVQIGNASTPSFSDTTATPGYKYYYYYIRANNAAGDSPANSGWRATSGGSSGSGSGDSGGGTGGSPHAGLYYETLIAIQKWGAPSGKTVVNKLYGTGSTYRWIDVKYDTALPTTGTDRSHEFEAISYDGDYYSDLMVIKKAFTTSGKTEVQILSGASGYKTTLLSAATVLPVTGVDSSYEFALGDYNRDGAVDLYAFKKYGTFSGKVELQILNGATKFQTYLLQRPTALDQLSRDGSWEFEVGNFNDDNIPDVYAVKKAGWVNGTLEVHVMSGASQYQNWLLQTLTPLRNLGSDYTCEVELAYFDQGLAASDVCVIIKRGTASSKTELHVLSHKSKFTQVSSTHITGLPETGSDSSWAFAFGWFIP